MLRSWGADVWSGLLFAAIGSGFALGSLRYSIGSAAQMEPGFFPLFLGLLLAGFGLALAVRGLTAGSDAVVMPNLRIAIPIVASLVVFGVVLPVVGLVPATVVLVTTGGLAIAGFPRRALAVTAVALSVFAALLFVGLLGINIPLWPSL